MTNHIVRSKWNWQFTRELSARIILQYTSRALQSPISSLSPTKNFNADFLITYLVHPGTAIYVGYNSNLQNLDRRLIPTPTGLLTDARRFHQRRPPVFCEGVVPVSLLKMETLAGNGEKTRSDRSEAWPYVSGICKRIA